LADRTAFLKAGIDLDHRLRPEAATGIGLLELRAKIVGADGCEGAREPVVFVYDLSIEVKYRHNGTLWLLSLA
jgi:hypothetical protein